jgi:RNA polymerase sigma factor (sigma-70 family)
MTEEEFDREWRAVAHQVERACCRALGNCALAADVAQQAAIRAWRGAATFRGDCPFSMWALRITRNEINRALRRLVRQRAREAALDTVAEDAPVLAAAAPIPRERPQLSWTQTIAMASKSGALTDQECRCVLQRLLAHDASWHEIGRSLGISEGSAAVLHCRAIPKLRVYLFMAHRGSLASPAEIEQAIRTAIADRNQRLSAAEEESFRRAVLADTKAGGARYSQSALRSACGKIIRHLAWDISVDDAPGATDHA